MVPKVVFKYSWIYDQNWKTWIKFYKRIKNYPSTRRILNYIPKIEKLWRKDEKKILKELSKVSGLEWKSKTICCYVVGRCIPFSDPLTLPVYTKEDYFIDVLVHELIHQLFTQEGNMEKSKKRGLTSTEGIEKNHKKTRIHIPLYAIHSHIYLKFFGIERLNRDKRLMNCLSEYKRAWEIVEKEGYEKIINEFKNRIVAKIL